MVYLVNLSERDYQRKKNKWLPKIFEWVKVRWARWVWAGRFPEQGLPCRHVEPPRLLLPSAWRALLVNAIPPAAVSPSGLACPCYASSATLDAAQKTAPCLLIIPSESRHGHSGNRSNPIRRRSRFKAPSLNLAPPHNHPTT